MHTDVTYSAEAQYAASQAEERTVLDHLQPADTTGHQHDVARRCIGVGVVGVRSRTLVARHGANTRTDERYLESIGQHAEHLEWTEDIE